MIPKTKKKKKNLQPSNNIQWQYPNLPPKIINLIATPSKSIQHITSLGCVTKSWCSSTKQCSPAARLPQLQISHKSKCSRIFQISSHHEIHPNYYYSENKTLTYKYLAPTLSFMSHSYGHSSSICTKGSEDGYSIEVFSTMVLTGISSPAFVFSSTRREFGWVLEDCNIIDPYAFNEYMKFTNAIGFEGKFYALSLQGSLVVIEYIDSHFRVSSTGKSRAVPCGVWRQFREYLLEWNGEILLVFLISRKSIGLVDDVEVFRLDMLKLSWVKVESLGECVLFLTNEHCFGLNARNVCRSNCIYFTLHTISEWYVYAMEIGQILPAFGPGCA